MESRPTTDSGMGWARKDTVCLLLVAVLLGFAIRLSGLEQIGLAEDEVNKIREVREYQQGVFTGNAEHPMLMKVLILASVSIADQWNRWFEGSPGPRLISEEVAIRFPNVLVGTLTAIPLFFVGAAFFSRRVGLLAAFLWATGIHAVFINRVAKEDTLLVFFMLWGLYFHFRMKTTLDESARRKRMFHLLSAACFGLLLASKYFPHIAGVSLLFFYLHRKYNPSQYPPDRYGQKDLALYLSVMAAAFLLANPMIVHPKVLAYILSYTGQATVRHHGYIMFGQLFPNSITLTPFGGTPWYFYLLSLAVKLPLLVLAAFLAGLVACLRRWRERGAFFILFWLLLWLVPYSIVGVKFLRYSLSLMPAVYLAAAFGTFVVVDWLGAHLRRSGLPAVRWATGAAAATLVTLVSLSTLLASRPFYSTYVNELGGGKKRVAYYFPHDECYDFKLREAIAETLRSAPPESVVAGETPATFHYYLARFHRPDIRVVNLSDSRFSMPVSSPVYVFLQPGRVYYENRGFYTHLWNQPRYLTSGMFEGKPMVLVCQLDAAEFMKIHEERQYVPLRSQIPEKQQFLTSDR